MNTGRNEFNPQQAPGLGSRPLGRRAAAALAAAGFWSVGQRGTASRPSPP
jgi:hypothetical protein